MTYHLVSCQATVMNRSMMTEKTNTKKALVDAAYHMFAERGFDGVSIAEIAGELGITKQALLHHYGSKEKLYGHVLEDLAVRFDKILNAHQSEHRTPKAQFLSIMRDLYQHMILEKHDAKLIVRELLDNNRRIQDKKKWYLRPFLETLSGLIQELSERELTKPQALAQTYQILGALKLFCNIRSNIDQDVWQANLS